ncbi:class I SAM-dependent methyltransferase [Aspergillus neoniger CBS 115656]|uniref:S-adenosyl-L-methionine-dependent methyltransferase n=1 Tax=Aspergillus neoniger (strain CBS 115656) TaxID=1448310 RepID=A0A318Y1H1_ASPNB|nr:S-adenosyl-L-methionine-dependent methyltransferase [Aspergillus neoniger CBS 115656]PYH28211.1 S-adenosyl-L-methionine-dependent methyltransferase [Aspergillus neoniger CBS 115656]
MYPDCPTMNDTPEIYPLARDKAESSRLVRNMLDRYGKVLKKPPRLNAQHKFLIDVVDCLIDSAIPLDNISTVADVGTGTGIWLVEARDFLNTKRFSPDRYFHGFDISSAQFPLSLPAGIGFSVQDILNPFPVEHHNRYDLVYVRMLVTAIRNTEYRDAVKNLLTILKPGGFLQWVELDCSALPNSKNSQNPRSAVIISSWLKFFQLNGLSEYAPSIIEDAYERSGMMDIINTSFSLDRRGEDLKAKAQKWQMQAFPAATVPIYAKN